MITDTTPRPDTVTVSVDEYADLVRSAALLDFLVIAAVSSGAKNPLYRFIAHERNIPITKTED